MIIKEIQFHNFLSYWGTNTFRLWDDEAGDSQLVLVLAPNSAGKSNFVRGLHFLCGSHPFLGEKAPHKAVNHRAVALAEGGDRVKGWVQATFQLQGETRTFRREVEAQVVGGHALRGKQTLSEVTLGGPQGQQAVPSIQQWLGRAVPQGLEAFFFFEGEQLAKRLIHSEDDVGVATDLRRLLHERPWDEALETLSALIDEVNKEMRKAASNDKQAVNALTVVQEKERERDRAQEALVRAQANLNEIESAVAQVENEIRQIPMSQSAGRLEQIQRDLDLATRDIENRKGEQTRLEIEFASAVGASAGLPFLGDFFNEALAPLRKLREENVLPAEIAAGFIERLIAQGKDGRCVCGRTLDPGHDDEAIACLRSYLDRTLQAEASNGLLELLNQLEGVKSGQFADRISSIQHTIKTLRSRMEVCSQKLRGAREQERDLRHQRGQVQVSQIRELQERQNRLLRQRQPASQELETAQRRLKVAEESRADAEKNLRHYDAMQRGDIRALQARRDRVMRVREAVTELKERLHEMALRGIQELMSESYDPRVPDSSRAHLNRKTLLPSILHEGQSVHALGGAQSQLLVLSFIRALAEVRLRIRQELAKIGILAGTLEAQPFVLDSVFGQAADQFRTACAKLVASGLGQRIVLVANQQWEGSVREVLEPHVTRAYALRVHTSQEAVWENGAKMVFRGNEVSVIEPLEGGDMHYTEAMEITPS